MASDAPKGDADDANSLPEVVQKDFAAGGIGHNPRGTSFVTPPDAFHPQSKTRHDDHVNRIFIGPHLVVTAAPAEGVTAAPAEYHRQHTFHHLAKRRHDAAKMWRKALRSGSEGKKKKEDLDAVEWRGGSFLVGADVREAYQEAKELEEKEKREAARKASDSGESTRARRRSRSTSVSSPDDMLKLLNPKKEDSTPPGSAAEASSSSPLLSPAELHGDSRPEPPHELMCRPETSEPRKGKSARFHEEPESTVEDRPAPPEEVLARPQPPAFSMKRTHDSASKEASFRSDRMLLKQGWSPRESLPHPFDAMQQRQYPVGYREWEEHLIEYKPRRLEFWGRSHGAGPHRWQGHLKLRHVIPLKKGHVNLSIYNHCEAAMCITISHASLTAAAARRRLNKHAVSDHFKAQGTTVFLLRPLVPSLLSDWVFDLWQELGGEIPSSVTVSIPELDARLVIPIPEEASHAASEWHPSDGKTTGAGYKVLTPTKVIQNCVKLVDQVGDWQQLHKERGGDDLELILAWRRADIIDWILEDQTLHGERRDAAVLAGYAYSQLRRNAPGGLELRTAVHYPDSAKIQSGQRMPEPPSVEGFLTRVQGAGGVIRERVYISTHSGHLFVNESKHAHPPEPPVPPEALEGTALKDKLALLGASYEQLLRQEEATEQKSGLTRMMNNMFGGDSDDLPVVEPEDFAAHDLSVLRQKVMQRFVEFEKRRVCEIAQTARGYSDLRNIKEVRRIAVTDDAKRTPEEIAASQEDDVIGEGSKDERSFEVEMVNGRIVRLEARDELDVQEWVTRLTSLSKYWQARQRADAIEQMATHTHEAYRTRSVFRDTSIGEAEAQDPSNFLPDPIAFSRIFDFCSIRGCRGILRFGRMFVTKGKRKRCKERWFALVRGSLLSFKIDKHHSLSGASKPADFHERSTSYPLKGCYLVTGHVCERHGNTASGERPFEGARNGRLYQDDLISYDEASECSFELWYGSDSKIGSRGHTAHFMARSKLDRDGWAACLGRELERLHREQFHAVM